MLTNSIFFKSFYNIKPNKVIKKKLSLIIKDKKRELFKSLTKNYKDNFRIKDIRKIVGSNDIRIIGMGGSILGAKAIYSFLNHKIHRKFFFIDNLISSKITNKKKSVTNLVISKSGNTLETISNVNILVGKKKNNIFITENKKNYLNTLAKKLKSEIIEHNNYIGGRYSVLSEVGMLPAQLMGLNPKKFRQLNNLIKNRKFLDQLVINTSSILFFSKNKFNSIILNYDHKSNNFFEWYRQLVAESLGKKSKGILPIVSNMPRDNHSVMQFYLDGIKNNFFTFFSCDEKISNKINKKELLLSHKYLGNYNTNQIILNQKKATEIVFNKKKIPFRSFELIERNEKVLGELFCFFILETILLGKALDVNPFDQPSVELIKKETRKQFF